MEQDYTYYPNSLHTIKFGWNYTLHRFIPSSVGASSGDVEFDTGEDVKTYGNESAIYLLDEWDVNENLKIKCGFRLFMYQHIGPFTRYYKNPNSGITDSTVNYSNFEPSNLFWSRT